MKCTCKVCEGRGSVPCGECDGEGSWTFSLLNLKVDRYTSNRERVMECQSAARQVARQAAELTAIFPHNSAKYEEQKRELIDTLEHEAARVMDMPKVEVAA